MDPIERLEEVGRLRFELERYVARCLCAQRAPSLAVLMSLLSETAGEF